MDPTAGLIAAAAGGGIDVTNVLVGVISAGAVLAASFITNRVAGRANRDSALLRWAEQLQASEAAARKEARESEDRADRIKGEADTELAHLKAQFEELKIQLRMATEASAKLTDTLVSVAVEVWRPEPDIPALRRMVGRPSASGVNGREV